MKYRLYQWFAVLMLLPLAAVAQAQETFQAGKDYAVLDYPLPAEDNAKIQVTEVFWYGCPHCYHFKPMIEAWEKKLPKDVNFSLMPAPFGGVWNTDAQAFYTAKALGVLDKVHDDLFDALARDHRPIKDEASFAKFFAHYGVKPEDFRKAWGSFGVHAKIQQATSVVRTAQISGVPTVLVDGKYKVDAEMAGSQENMLKVINYLIEKTREARKAQAAN
jgi:thiol:disulfide interchange protein DsbA